MNSLLRLSGLPYLFGGSPDFFNSIRIELEMDKSGYLVEPVARNILHGDCASRGPEFDGHMADETVTSGRLGTGAIGNRQIRIEMGIKAFWGVAHR